MKYFKVIKNMSNFDSKRKKAVAVYDNRAEADQTRQECEDKVRLMSFPGCFYTVEESDNADKGESCEEYPEFKTTE